MVFEISIFINIVLFVLTIILFSYLRQKGKNWATKNDIEKITKLTEEVRSEIGRRDSIDNIRRNLKYEACLEALTVLDADLSQVYRGEGAVPQKVSTKCARLAHNKLILSCDAVDIVNLFGRICFDRKTHYPSKELTDLLNEFRIEVRKELGFGEAVELDQNHAWIVKMEGDSNAQSADTPYATSGNTGGATAPSAAPARGPQGSAYSPGGNERQ